MGGIYKDKEKEQEEDDSFDAGFTIPETKGVLGKLATLSREALVQEHIEEEEEDKRKGKKRQKPKGGTICHCYREGCTIGGFVQRSGE